MISLIRYPNSTKLFNVSPKLASGPTHRKAFYFISANAENGGRGGGGREEFNALHKGYRVAPYFPFRQFKMEDSKTGLEYSSHCEISRVLLLSSAVLLQPL